MKTLPLLLAATTFSAPFLSAAPLDRRQVGNDATWLMHADVDNLRDSEFGKLLLSEIKSSVSRQGNGSVSLDPEAIAREINSITAYGTPVEKNPEATAVAVIQAGPKAQAIIDGYIASLELSEDGKTPFKVVAGKAYPTYLVGNELYLSFPRKDLIIAGKDFSRIEQALKVIEGSAPSLSKDSRLASGPDPKGFFLLAAAEGIDRLNNIPPQARILQKTTGLHLAAGQKGADILLEVMLQTTGPEVSAQLRRIVDGMVALASLAEVDQENLGKVVQAVKVSDDDTSVKIRLQYPFDELRRIGTALVASSRNRGTRTITANGNVSVATATPKVYNDATGGEVLKVVNVDAKSDNGNPPRRAIDGNPATHWGAAGRQQWLRLELDQPSLVREVKIAWLNGDTKPTRFIVQGSTNGNSWTELYSGASSGKAAEIESYNVVDTPVSWVRIWVIGTTGAPSSGIAELQILGQPGVTLPTPAITEPARTSP